MSSSVTQAPGLMGDPAPVSGTLALVRRAGGVAFTIQVAGAGIAYLQQVLLARLLGVSHYGLYTYIYLWVGFVALLAGLGLPAASLRFVPAYRAAGDAVRLHGFVRTAGRFTYASALAGAAVAVLAGVAVGRPDEAVLLAVVQGDARHTARHRTLPNPNAELLGRLIYDIPQSST